MTLFNKGAFASRVENIGKTVSDVIRHLTRLSGHPQVKVARFFGKRAYFIICDHIHQQVTSLTTRVDALAYIKEMRRSYRDQIAYAETIYGGPLPRG